MKNEKEPRNIKNSTPSNRRDFLKSSVLLGAAACVPAILVPSCTEKKATSSNDSQNENNMPAITVRRTLGKGSTAMEVSALGWLLQKAPYIVPIPGTTKLSHLEENLRTLDFTFSQQEWNELETAVANIPIIGDRYPASEQKQLESK